MLQRLNLLRVPLKVKGTFLPASQLQPTTEQLAQWEKVLQERLEQGASLLYRTPLVLDLSQIDTSQPIDLAALVRTAQQLGLSIVAVRAQEAALEAQAEALGLAFLGRLDRSTPAANQEEVSEPKIHLGTVRGGQQVIHEQGDLVILGSVNPGGEVLASGHIYIYGSLRGKALAGIYGDAKARIVAQELNAELVAIDGHYRTSQKTDFLTAKKPAYLVLKGQDVECHFF
ncbi:septum site-determining protein MinC [Marinospirillum sp. MEB164]|uniref:Probable septum site-determining protein MinC n=1 Tax=Marinospirillum alkalitolerans TaxID=3123374 RepID=A0ABW8PUT7_9GAMM